ncbi:MAG TPA: cytochrome c-type biogenesis protein CcmH [Polyangiaceae bacterium LLY-WYZ-15_(1-7)]|nr:cytochrome c-type biogenesis protein CcmH [Polyangiaceae bacterium LLY-WYZ-15_(1-7)]HJL08985.1 cytochrome c-type biogenesis protein CcmH [Polyangiaceae bacterium LLY-WYZ-15_(1-7)]HJL30386.1 cytochrome c-type biogenesis protein CcmH [Polyangiaceae bacterium LLY-WYZ-15_(1-7)]HJL37757.1 cytochrome c-type biogenesis protein CcmH [Polyangiaceae bacterium LLY-WYZ-15_(1-7)]HJL49974.1 cytochrome c-type biogenesis protein CcmH [Polyangiaceae bacterium LLY-WYZ-15_(1-7)]
MRLLLPFALLTLVAASPRVAAQPTSDGAAAISETDAARRAVSLSRRTMSPFCPGRTLDDCPSSGASRWRQDIRRWVDEGASDATIYARLEERAPEGFDLEGRPTKTHEWLFAGAAFALASLVLVLAARKLVRRREEEGPEPGPPGEADDALDERLDEELARLG